MLVFSYMIVLASLVVYTALNLGGTEPQWALYRLFGSAALAQSAFLLAGLAVVASYLLVAWLPEKKYLPLPSRVNRVCIASLDRVHGLVMAVTMGTRSLVAAPIAATAQSTATGVPRRSYWPLFVKVSAVIIFTGVILTSSTWANAQIVEPGFESEVVAEGLVLPTAIAFTPDGRIFVAQKGGSIRIIQNGELLDEPLVTLTDVNNFGDRGLLGLAVDPNFAQNGYIYVSYTHENTPGVNVAGSKTGRIVRLTVFGNSANEFSRRVLVGSVGGTIGATSCDDYDVTADCIPSDSNTHSVGGLRFGPDGMLYATLGDGADFVAVDPRALRAQDLDSLGGKVLRINRDGTGPTDNPFYTGDPNDNRSKVYALGVRNAFRFNFHPTTGQLYIGDVGWGDYEALYRGVPGANYGWPCLEGSNASAYDCEPSSPVTDPFYEYSHGADGAAIIAGAFPSSGAYPAQYDNSFFMADYALRWIKRLELDSSGTEVIRLEDFADNVFPVDMVTGPGGNLYYIDIVFGTLNRITHTDGKRRPIVELNVDRNSGELPLAVAFSGAGSYDPDGDALSYFWNFGDGTSSSEAEPTHTYTSAGTYIASLTVTDEFGASATRNVTIFAGNQAPEVTITNPPSGSLYQADEEVTVSATAVDPEDGVLPPDAFSWEVLLHHNVHYHTLLQDSGTRSATFPAEDHDATDVYIEVIVTAEDSQGLTTTQSIYMYLDSGVGSGNLIANPSLEIESSLPGTPRDWSQSAYGTMRTDLTYPVAGLEGHRAASIDVTSYSSGAAKWVFSPTFVSPGQDYIFTNLYTATRPTEVLVQFTRLDGSFAYEFLGVVPASDTPRRNSFTFTVPERVQTATVFHEITGVGELVVDDFSLRLATGGDMTPPYGMITNVSAGDTFSGTAMVAVDASDDVAVGSVELQIDGEIVGVGDAESPYRLSWDTTAFPDGSYDLAAQVSDTSGITFTTPTISVVVANGMADLENLILNGDFETPDGDRPLGWTQGSGGTLTAEYRYPVTGVTSDSLAAEVEITEFAFGDTGDARWEHTPVPVTQGTEYTYRTMYRASSISDVIGRYTFADGSDHHFGLLKEIPPTDDWTQLENTFVPPPGAETVTFFHLISSRATLTVDNVELYATGTGEPSEINPPFVDFISPLDGDTVSGTVTLTATSSDDTGVVGVYFAVNGSPYGPEDFTPPYQVEWDTTGFPDGEYLLKATSHDVYGNNDNVEIWVTVDNSSLPDDPEPEPDPDPTPPTGDNRISNGDLNTAGSDGDPLGWNRGGWGSNDRSFTYPVSGYDDGSAAEVAISSYTDGDAKWYFDPVTIEASEAYQISHRYQSTVPTTVLIQYTMADGAYTYGYVADLPAAASWAQFSDTIEPPAGATHLTLFHVIGSVGSLTIDDVVLTGGTGDPTPPTDLDPDPTDPDPTPPTGENLVTNPSFETADSSGDTLGWNRGGWGSNDRSFTYPVSGYTGSAAEVTIGSYTDGDAKWYFDPVPIQPNTTYTIGNYYQSDAPSSVVLQYTLSDGSVAYEYLSDLPAASSWTEYRDTVTTPADATHLTIFHLIGTTGSLAIDDVVVFGATGDEPEPPPTDLEPPPSDPDPTPPTGDNLISNGDLNTAGSDGDPLGWNRGGWGSNDRSFTYPVSGYDGGSAAEVTISSYTDGDAKWYFDPVSIQAGATYEIGNRYLSDVSSDVLVQYTMDDDSYRYEYVTDLSLATSWSDYSATVVAPAGATHLTVFHILATAGSLTIDTMYVFGSPGDEPTEPEPEPDPEPPPTEPEPDPEPPPSDPDPTPPTGDNRISNGDLNTAGSDGDPLGWNRGGWGSNDRSFTYPVSGYSGSAARVSISSYTDGDAKWYFDPVAVTPGEQYTFSYRYQATVPTDITLTYTMDDESITYVGVDTPTASADWSSGTFSFTPPTGAVAVSVLHSLAQVGTLTIDDHVLVSGNPNTLSRGMVSFSFDDGWVEHATYAGPTLQAAETAGTFYINTDVMEDGTSPGFVDTAQVLDLQSMGHEIGAHSRSHTSLVGLDAATLAHEVAGSRQALLDAGVSAVPTFAYPYGDADTTVRQATIDAGFSAARGVTWGYNDRVTDRYDLRVQQVDRSRSLAEMQAWIDEAAAQNVWLILMFHQINDDLDSFYGITESEFASLLSHTTSADVDIVTVADGVNLLD